MNNISFLQTQIKISLEGEESALGEEEKEPQIEEWRAANTIVTSEECVYEKP